MTNWSARKFNIPLTFLDDKEYTIEILKDGVNVGKQAFDYQIVNNKVNSRSKLAVEMAGGGGYVAILTPINN